MLTGSPDVILIQRRPDYHLHNFQFLPRTKDGQFSQHLFLSQLKFSPAGIKPPAPSARPIFDASVKAQESLLEQRPEKEILQPKGFELCTKFASAYATPLYFGEMPMRSYREWLANSHTLAELQSILKTASQQLPKHQPLFSTPYQMATFIDPDRFLKPNDIYMATLIEVLIATQQHKRIFGIFGPGQN
jgi:hypothetical protein